MRRLVVGGIAVVLLVTIGVAVGALFTKLAETGAGTIPPEASPAVSADKDAVVGTSHASAPDIEEKSAPATEETQERPDAATASRGADNPEPREGDADLDADPAPSRLQERADMPGPSQLGGAPPEETEISRPDEPTHQSARRQLAAKTGNDPNEKVSDAKEPAAQEEKEAVPRPDSLLRLTSVKVSPSWPVPGGSLALTILGEGIGDRQTRFQWRMNPNEEFKDLEAELDAAETNDNSVTWRTVWDSLPEGKFHLEVRAADSNGRTSAPAGVDIEIKRPAGPQWDRVAKDAPREITNSIGMKFALIPPGESVLGSLSSDPDHGPDEEARGVRIAEPFYLGCHEVTEEDFFTVIPLPRRRTDPNQFGSITPHNNRPISNVSFVLANRFCEWLSNRPEEAKAGRSYRLPTETEWEYACRAGTTTRFNTGNLLSSGLAAFGQSSTVDDDKFPPNAFGLYAMHGNVREWCAEGVSRGGWAKSPLSECRSASRSDHVGPTAAGKHGENGLRLVCRRLPPRAPAEVAFFNGRDLAGWESGAKGPEAGPSDVASAGNWTVEQGEITGRPGREPDNLNNLGRFGDFLLTFQLRAAELCACRLRIRGELVYEDVFFVEGASIELWPSGEMHTVGDGSAGSSDNVRPDDATRSLLQQTWKPGDYNSFSVLCVGERCAYMINGVPVFDATLKRLPREGHIGFYVHEGARAIEQAPTIDGREKVTLRRSSGPSGSAVRIKDVRFEAVTNGDEAFQKFRAMIDPDVARLQAAERAERERPKYDLTGIWILVLRGNRGADTLYDMRQDGAKFVASFGNLGESLSGSLEGTMEDATVRGNFTASALQGTFELEAHGSDQASMSWRSATGQGDSFNVQRIGDRGTDEKTYDLTGTWVGEETKALYHVKQTKDGRVHAQYTFGDDNTPNRMEGIVLGNKCLGCYFADPPWKGRTEWEIHDATTATIHWIPYPQYPPNPSYGRWNSTFRVKRVQSQ